VSLQLPSDVTDLIDELQGLRPEERDRLERFALAFDRLDAGSYALFAEIPDQDAIGRAQVAALDRVGTGRRRAAVRAAVRAFTDEATVAYARRFSLPDTVLLFQSLPDRAEDRLRFLGSVERAVVGLLLWDELEPDDLAALIGPWGAYVEDSA
jgi:hypothetical protein